MLAPVLVDGRLGGHWRLAGSGASRELSIRCFTGSRRPRKTELEEPVAALSSALAVTVTSVTIERS
jgi:hypothetical protein